ncbi:MAG: hypothetical protein GY869_00055, partial [Planctomycetes bacterium]|nr:hypothetical protein [Planctomycetota bacterium]
MHFRDMPMQAKLMMLTLGVGILPLSVIAGFTVWDTVTSAENVIAKTTRIMLNEIRSETERHELLLQLWASQLNNPSLTDADRELLVDQWRKLPETFTDLGIVDLSEIEHKMTPDTLGSFKELGIMFYAEKEPINPFANDYLRAIIRLNYDPNKVLSGLAHWYEDSPLTEFSSLIDEGGMLVIDGQGRGQYSRVPPELEDWIPQPKLEGDPDYYTVKHGGHEWHVADIEVERLGWRFIRLTSAKVGMMTVLTMVPNTLALIINLSIFGSLIIGGKMASRISNRVLTIAEYLCQSGGRPEALKIPIRGRDELGYLADTLNRIS